MREGEIDVNMAAVSDSPHAAESTNLPVSMVERLALILQVFESREPGARVSLEEICQQTGLARSTAHRILEQLVNVRWLGHGRSGYALGGRLLGLSDHESGDRHLRRICEPVLQAIHRHTGRVLHLAVPEARNMRYLLRIAGPRSMVPSRVGGLVHVHASALGKAYLAAITPETVDRMLKPNLPLLTNRTVPSLQMLHVELGRIRQNRGLAREIGEAAESIACLAAPLYQQQEPVGSISIVTSDSLELRKYEPLLLDAARTISSQLGRTRNTATA